jgi:hypothetical protein
MGIALSQAALRLLDGRPRNPDDRGQIAGAAGQDTASHSYGLTRLTIGRSEMQQQPQ